MERERAYAEKELLSVLVLEAVLVGFLLGLGVLVDGDVLLEENSVGQVEGNLETSLL